MGKLNELFNEASYDLEVITTSQAEARRFLQHAAKTNFNENDHPWEQQRIRQPA